MKNGVKGMYIVEGNDKIKQMEPYVSDEAVAALVVPSGGIASPYEMCIAYAENAAQNGVEFRFLSEVTGIKQTEGGFDVTCATAAFTKAKWWSTALACTPTK